MRHLIVAVVAGALLALGAAASASAATMSCPSKPTVLPNGAGYQCAETAASGQSTLSFPGTQTWTSTTAPGYDLVRKCTWRSSADLQVGEVWEGQTYTAFASSYYAGSRSWAAGVVFTTGAADPDKVGSSCNNQGQISTGILALTTVSLSGPATATVASPAPFTATLSPSGATGPVTLVVNGAAVASATPSEGQATLTWTPPAQGTYTVQARYGGTSAACPALTAPCGSTTASSDPLTVTAGAASATVAPTGLGSPPRGLRVLAAAAPDDPLGLVTRTRTATFPAHLALTCPTGTVLIHADTLRSRPGRPLRVVERLRGARLVAASGARGERVSLQVTCRRLGLPRLLRPRLGYGTVRPDVLSTARASGALFGGPGGDRLTVRGRAGVAFGDLGDDRIVVSGTSGVAMGGPGADRLVATRTARSLLVGGPGHDTFLAGPGRTVINAVDGERDRVLCTGEHNRVLVDRRDVVTGPCRPLLR